MDSQSFVGEKHLASSRNLGLAISFAIHVFLGSGFVALNTVTAEQADFESLEVQSLEVNTLSADELQAIIALLELDPEVSEEGTNLSVIPVNEKAASATLIGAKSNSESTPVELSQVTEEKEIPEPEPEPLPPESAPVLDKEEPPEPEPSEPAEPEPAPVERRAEGTRRRSLGPDVAGAGGVSSQRIELRRACRRDRALGQGRPASGCCGHDGVGCGHQLFPAQRRPGRRLLPAGSFGSANPGG